MSSFEVEMKSQMFTDKVLFSILFATCCPCYVIAEMRTKVVREERYSIFNTSMLSSLNGFGPKGALTCFQTAVLALIGWPFSPLIGLYVGIQHLYLKKLYDHDYENRITCSCCCSLFQTSLFWPISLNNHKHFIRSREFDGTLRFDWEYEINATKKAGVVEDIVYIVGPSNSGKNELFRKLLSVCSDEHSKLASKPHSQIRAGIRASSIIDNSVKFLEIWNFPAQKNELLLNIINRSPPNCILLTFDSVDMKSFEDIQWLYHQINSKLFKSSSILQILLANKVDIFSSDHPSAKDNSTLNLAKLWAEENNIIFLEVSSFSNIGMLELRKIILSNVAVHDQS